MLSQDLNNNIKHLTCPGYVAKSGAELFGIAGTNGEVIYLKEAIAIDNTFIEETKNGRPAEERFRFSGKCIEGGCNQWGNNECGLAKKLIHIINKPVAQSLQDCAIRHKCRWYEQEKDLACANCTEVFRNQASKIYSHDTPRR